jgi:hypothetical protein
MSGDALRKVRPGDPLRVPAQAWNAIVDAVRAQRESRHTFGRTPRPDVARANIAHAYNASGQTAPLHGVVDLVAPSHTESQLEFVKPGSGSGAYGITFEPIAPGAIGLVALSGGVYEALVSGDAAPGDRLKPVTGTWQLEKGSGVFQAVADPKDGLVRVVFASGVTYYAGRHISIYEDEWGRLVIRETGTRADGSEQLRIEVRDSDPGSVSSGAIWLRSDL